MLNVVTKQPRSVLFLQQHEHRPHAQYQSFPTASFSLEPQVTSRLLVPNIKASNSFIQSCCSGNVSTDLSCPILKLPTASFGLEPQVTSRPLMLNMKASHSLSWSRSSGDVKQLHSVLFLRRHEPRPFTLDNKASHGLI